MLGHLMEWFFAGLGGIKQNDHSAGYKLIEISPQIFENLKKARVDYDSPYGVIGCDWLYENNALKVKVQIPANTECLVKLPYKDVVEARESGIRLDESEDCRIVEQSDEKLVIRIGSGNYTFELSY